MPRAAPSRSRRPPASRCARRQPQSRLQQREAEPYRGSREDAEADYNFKPGPAPELRNFGQLFAHVANAQFGSCATALGQPNPNQGHNLETELKTKAEFTKALADSFALCDKAFAALTDQNAMEMVKQGQGEIARAALLANVVIHSNEMYGTGSVYMRAKGLVPPSTERPTDMPPGRGAARS